MKVIYSTVLHVCSKTVTVGQDKLYFIFFTCFMSEIWMISEDV